MDFRPAITDVYNGKKLVVIGNLFVNDVFHGNGRPYAKVRISYFVPNAAIQDEQTKEKNKYFPDDTRRTLTMEILIKSALSRGWVFVIDIDDIASEDLENVPMKEQDVKNVVNSYLGANTFEMEVS